jgi:3-oxoacyl-[acyl-carrier-protein] synthase-1
MTTSVGVSSLETAASVRAGISRYKASSIFNSRFRAMTMCLVPDGILPPLASPLETTLGLTARQIRMLRLATLAIRSSVEKAPGGLPLPLLLALPEQLPNCPPPTGDDFLDRLALQTGVPLDRQTSAIFPFGRAGGLYAVARGLELISRGTHDFALVGGVDTYLDLYLLGVLDTESRVLADGVMDGFAPGEGSAFLLLASDRGRSLRPAAKVHPPGLAIEPGHRYSTEPYKGEGLAEAVAIALSMAKGGSIRSVFASLNGENFGAKEWGVAFLRSKALFDDGFRLFHPAEFYGDPGAACAPLLMGLATLALDAGHIEGPALIWCASELGHRGAIVLARSSEGA